MPDNLDQKLLWATAFLFFWMGVAMLKLWLWMQMDKVGIIREIKRLELQIARRSGGGGG